MKVLIKDEGMVELIKLKRYILIQIQKTEKTLSAGSFLPTEEKIYKTKLAVYREILDQLKIYNDLELVKRSSMAGHIGRGR